jgi:NTE family protein
MQQRSDHIPPRMQTRVLTLLRTTLGLPPDQDLSDLLPRFSWVHLQGGTPLFNQGDAPDAAYLLIHGHLKAIQIVEGETKVLGDIATGQLIGEMGLISEDARTASVIASRDCHLVRISREDFRGLVLAYPAYGWNVAKLILQRNANHPKRRNLRYPKNLAFLAANSSIDLSSFLQRVRENMSNHSIAHIRNDQPSSQSTSDLIAKIDQLEIVHDFVFLEMERNQEDWSQFCIRQADEVILVADAKHPIDLHFLKQCLCDKDAIDHYSLVLLHPEGIQRPVNTSDYFQEIPFDSWFHIRTDTPADWQRLIRHFTCSSVGLVLAGGGARGFAHIGVWKAIKELDLPIDCIGGTSMGAFLGGLMSLEHDYRYIYEMIREVAQKNPANDFNPIPYVSILQGKKLNRILQKNYAGLDIRDCWIPYYCVSMNLTSMQGHLHQEGDFFKATRASGSLPGIFPPVPINGHWHVDGGIFDNFPVQPMIDRGFKHIIGVALDQKDNPSANYTRIPGLKSQFVNGLLKLKTELEIPSLVETVLLSTLANSHQRKLDDEKKVDLLIQPQVKEIGILEWKGFEKAVEAGYQSAMQALSAWKHHKYQPFFSRI